MRILLSNDDGYGAEGIDALCNYLKCDHEVWVIAPDRERSATGHSLSVYDILRLNKIEENHYSCNGFPADCISLGLQTVMKDSLPDLVISGINRGSNLGQDTYYSGTCAAAREASFFGIPSIALSLDVRRKEQAHYRNLFPILDKIMSEESFKSIPKFCSLNINAPNTERSSSNWKYCEVGFARYSGRVHESCDPKGQKYYWLGSGERVLDTSKDKMDVYWSEKREVTVSPCRWIANEENNFAEIEAKLG